MIIALTIIGYLVAGYVAFYINWKQDKKYRMYLWKNFEIKEAIPVDAIYWSSGNDALDEYHRRTQWLPKKIEGFFNIKIMTVVCFVALIEWMLWPIVAVASSIYNAIVYKQILAKAES